MSSKEKISSPTDQIKKLRKDIKSMKKKFKETMKKTMKKLRKKKNSKKEHKKISKTEKNDSKNTTTTATKVQSDSTVNHTIHIPATMPISSNKPVILSKEAQVSKLSLEQPKVSKLPLQQPKISTTLQTHKLPVELQNYLKFTVRTEGTGISNTM